MVFRRGHLPKDSEDDEESHKNPGARDVIDGNSIGTDQTVTGIQRQTKVFHWSDVCYDITIKGQDRRILDHVDGWVKPGTLTALMVCAKSSRSNAHTKIRRRHPGRLWGWKDDIARYKIASTPLEYTLMTFLDVLATRTTMGVITGEMFVNGHPRDICKSPKTVRGVFDQLTHSEQHSKGRLDTFNSKTFTWRPRLSVKLWFSALSFVNPTRFPESRKLPMSMRSYTSWRWSLMPKP